MDLTKITTPLGLLDAETQAALKAHGGPYERFESHGWADDVRGVNPAIWTKNIVRRVKPQRVTKPSIDWSHVVPQFKWLTRDRDGTALIFDVEPYAVDRFWHSNGIHVGRAEDFASYTPGTCDWRDSLVERPEGA